MSLTVDEKLKIVDSKKARIYFKNGTNKEYAVEYLYEDAEHVKLSLKVRKDIISDVKHPNNEEIIDSPF